MQNVCKNEYAIMSSSYAVRVCVPEGTAFEVGCFQKDSSPMWELLLILLIHKTGERWWEMISEAPPTVWGQQRYLSYEEVFPLRILRVSANFTLSRCLMSFASCRHKSLNCNVERASTSVQKKIVWIAGQPTDPLLSFCTAINFSEPQFAHLQNGDWETLLPLSAVGMVECGHVCVSDPWTQFSSFLPCLSIAAS